ncbi:hypothetical protein [Leucothrix pacifica]|uniref:Cytochrome c domain-containing protein n=1 Tax=Leucothrix pacifica TaxID=1247513 RepID=A0A317CV58_9GAMM|nr:hypothetical protein [Leucothrix pacifica]PWR00233.1 hypothetical protein DKW60_03590 [Leucothrix pacifica]
MFRILLAAITLSFAGSVFAAGDATNGKVLFEKRDCLSCHGTEAFTSEDRKIKNLKALEVQVRLCDSNLNNNWFDEEIHDVVAYLNEQYYKFPEPAEAQ